MENQEYASRKYILRLLLFIVGVFIQPVVQNAQVVQLLGDSESNLVYKAKVYGTNLYFVTIQDNNQSILFKYDLAGNQVWKLELSGNFRVGDLALNGDKIMLVGNNGAGNNSNLNSILAVVTDGITEGTLDFIQEYGISNRDNFTRVIAKPGSSTTFYVQHYYSGTADDVAILEIDNTGTQVGSVSYNLADDQFWAGMRGDQSTITLSGNMGGTNTGCFVEMDNTLSVSRAYQYNQLADIRDYLDRDNGRKVLLARTASPQAIIFEIDSNNNVVWSKEISGLERAVYMYLVDHTLTQNGFKEEYIINGYNQIVPGEFRQILVRFEYVHDSVSGDQYNIIWSRYLEENTPVNSSASAGFDYHDDQIFLLESKINSANGFGGNDVLQAITNDAFETCLTQDLSFTVSDYSLTPTALSFTEGTVSLPSPVSLSVADEHDYSSFGYCCETSSITVSTGYNPITETTYGEMEQVGFWILQEAPTDNGTVTLNAPSWNIGRYSAWSSPPFNSTYISAFPIPGSNMRNIGMSTTPYLFQRCFCVESDNTELEFDLEVHVDNNLQLFFLEQGNAGSRVMLDEVTGSVSANFKGAPEELNISPITVPTAGTYCLDAELRNDHKGSPMGLNISGTITGAGLLSDGCCSVQSFIAGFKYRDHDCDGVVQMGDPVVPNWEIELYDSEGMLVTTTTTDANGYYAFDVTEGTYTVREVLQADWEYSVPSLGEYTDVTVIPNTITSLDFGNMYTGPIVTDPVSSTCAQAGSSISFSWFGQECDCGLELRIRSCGSSEDWATIADIQNTGSYSWSIPDYYAGNYEFQILDCDGNQIAFAGCVEIGDFSVDISYVLTGCGEYMFSPILTGIDPAEVTTYQWNFDALGGSSNEMPSFTFESAGSYSISLYVSDSNGCTASTTINLEVVQGSSDPNCNYCDPDINFKLDGGDLMLCEDCRGIILKSPDGGCYRIRVLNGGIITSEAVECP